MEKFNYILEKLKEKYNEGVEINYIEHDNGYDLSIKVTKGEEDYIYGDIGVNKEIVDVEDIIIQLSHFIEELLGK